MDNLDLVSLIAICIVRLTGGKVKLPGESFECESELAEELISNNSARVAEPIPVDDDGSGKSSTEGDDLGGGTDATGTDGGDSEPVADADKADDSQAEKDSDGRVEAIKGLLVEWLKSDPEQKDETKWKKDGDPRNKSVDTALKINVSNDELLPIWNVVKATKDGGDE